MDNESGIGRFVKSESYRPNNVMFALICACAALNLAPFLLWDSDLDLGDTLRPMEIILMIERFAESSIDSSAAQSITSPMLQHDIYLRMRTK